MDCYEIDLKAEFTGILCTMALNMSRHLSSARQNKIMLLPELKKVVRNLICCECDSSLEIIHPPKNRRPCKPPCKKKECPQNKPNPEEKCIDDCLNPRRKFIPPERISVKIKNLRHVKPQSSTILTKRRLSACKASNETDQSQNSTYIYRQQKNPDTNRRDRC